MIKLKRVLSFSEIGQKDNQEDRIYPCLKDVKSNQRYFILCDGMGGHEHGEVASEAVSSALGQYFDNNPVEVADEAYFNAALSYAYDQLDPKDTGGEKKMGTTLTCLIFNPDGYLAAHIGDSRIYHFRDGKPLFQTRDHSLVNDLLKAGEITPEEAENYPRKNVITRAMQPNAKRCKADVYVCNDVQPGDYFFLCCDGVLEHANDKKLLQIFSEKSSASKKLSAIKAECDKGTKDNYTCWLLEVGGRKKSRFASVLAIVVLLALLAVGGIFFMKHSTTNADTSKAATDSLKQEIVSRVGTSETKLENIKQVVKDTDSKE